ncbi:MAG TPA: methyl-accepting chemotaxis protein [Chloroflexota bacterium]|nr:methyl-accepting chemotaxis protein [Chloroflexota bacterium]
MTAHSIRSGFIGLAVVAAILDVVALISALASGALAAAILAILAGAVTVIGALWTGTRLSAYAEIHDKQIEQANSQVVALTRQVGQAADYLNQAGTNAASDDSQDLLSNASNTIETIADATAEQLEKSDKAHTIAERMGETVSQTDKAIKENIAATENVTHAVAEISRALEETATNAQKVAAASEEAASLAQGGEDAVRRTIQSIGLIKQTVLGSAEKVQQLAARANQIGDIVKLIDDIADQTNLLALNAAIEAARAGEQGKGFAVVASEVRKLAERTSRATKDIGDLIKTTQDETSAAVDAMHVGSQEVEEGSNLGAEAGNALQQILDSVARNTEQVQNISAAVEEMTAAANEILNAVETQADKFRANSNITGALLQDLDQLSSFVGSVTDICRGNAAASNDLAKQLQQRRNGYNGSRNGDLRQLASQLKQAVGV